MMAAEDRTDIVFVGERHPATTIVFQYLSAVMAAGHRPSTTRLINEGEALGDVPGIHITSASLDCMALASASAPTGPVRRAAAGLYGWAAMPQVRIEDVSADPLGALAIVFEHLDRDPTSQQLWTAAMAAPALRFDLIGFLHPSRYIAARDAGDLSVGGERGAVILVCRDVDAAGRALADHLPADDTRTIVIDAADWSATIEPDGPIGAIGLHDVAGTLDPVELYAWIGRTIRSDGRLFGRESSANAACDFIAALTRAGGGEAFTFSICRDRWTAVSTWVHRI